MLRKNQVLYSSILVKVTTYSTTNGEGWWPITETVKGDVPICQVNGWPNASPS